LRRDATLVQPLALPGDEAADLEALLLSLPDDRFVSK